MNNNNGKNSVMLRDLINQAYDLTINIKEAINTKEIDSVDNFLDQREGVLTIIDELMSKVDLNYFNEYYPDTFRIIQKIEEIDQGNTEKLHEIREEIGDEIAQNFRNKEKLKNYNLNNIR